MTRKLPLYAERALGQLHATRGYTVTEFEKQFRANFAVSCKPGCAHCCHYPLYITVAEGLILYRYLASKGRLTGALRKRLAEHADVTAFIDPAVWMRSAIPCPLLDDKKHCVGYEGRPQACRMTFSAGDPDKCDPQAYDPSEQGSTREIARASAAFEDKLLRAHGISPIRIPVSRALQIAERVLSGELALNRIELTLYQEYKA